MGDNCKLQNYALVYEPAVLEDGVFVGPAVVFTNDHFPRAVSPDGTLKTGDDWEAVGVTCRTGASIGARSVCVAPVTIGRWALRSEEHTSELQSHVNLVCRLLLEKKKKKNNNHKQTKNTIYIMNIITRQLCNI